MKTIAELPENKVLVELTKDELANICGHYSSISNDYKLKIGVEIDVSDIYKKHRLINSLQQTNEYEKARNKIKDILNALTPIEDKINIIKTN
jgi:hypothetical protein